MHEINEVTHPMSAQLTEELRKKLLTVDSPTVSNAIEKLDVRSRREGYMGPEIVCRFPEFGSVVGYATTCTIVEYDEHYPPDPAERDKWIESIANSPKPSICVVKDTCHRKGWSSRWGEIMGTQIQVLGAVGIVTDGAVRDLDALEAMKMHVWSEHVVVSHGHIDVGVADIPVEVGGLVVRPGDLLHADRNGVVAIPPETLDRLAETIDEILDDEKKIIAKMRATTGNLKEKQERVDH